MPSIDPLREAGLICLFLRYIGSLLPHFFFCSRNLVCANMFVPKMETEIALVRAYYLKKRQRCTQQNIKTTMKDVHKEVKITQIMLRKDSIC